MTNEILLGKPDAGNPHVRFDEGEDASTKPRRGSLLHIKVFVVSLSLGFVLLAAAETTLDWKFDKSGRTEVVPPKAETSFSSPTDLRWWTECSSTGIFRRGVCVIVR